MRKLSLKPIFAWLRRKMLRKRVGLLAIGIGVPWLWLMWQFFGPLSAFPVSAETTIFTEPLTPQGYVDYIKIFQDRYQHPDAKPAKEDPWSLLAGALENTPEQPKGLPKFHGISSLLDTWRADHPEREADVMRYLTMSSLPVAAVHDFQISANGSAGAKKFLEDNEPWYASVKMSEPTPAIIEPLGPLVRVFPVDEPIEEIGLHQLREARSRWYANQIAGPFLFRAAMFFEAGKLTEGLADLQVVYKAARNCERYLLIGYRRSLGIEKHANTELINGLVLCHSIDTAIACQLIQSSAELLADEDVIKILDERYRFEALDRVQFIHRHPGFGQWNVVKVPARYRTLAGRYAAHRVDFSELLKFQNRIIDYACEAMRKPTFREQHELIDALLVPLRLLEAANADSSFFSHDYQSLLESRIQIQDLPLIQLPQEIASVVNSRRVLHLAVRLARWRTINGHYPDSLDVLNSIPGLPPLPEEVLIDAFSNEPLRYERVGDRYQVRSAGEDMEFNDSVANDVTWPSKELLRPN